MAASPRPRVTKECPNCKKLYTTYFSVNGMYCSRRCRHEYDKRLRFEANARSCQQCGVRFAVKNVVDLGLYCSHRCQGLARRLDRVATGRYFMVRDPEHPNARDGYVLEHRRAMATVLGRPLLPTEVVHHVDGNPGNNDPGNLMVMTPSEHTKLHAELRRKARS